MGLRMLQLYLRLRPLPPLARGLRSLGKSEVLMMKVTSTRAMSPYYLIALVEVGKHDGKRPANLLNS